MLKCAKSFFLSGTKSKEVDITCTLIKKCHKREQTPFCWGIWRRGGWLRIEQGEWGGVKTQGVEFKSCVDAKHQNLTRFKRFKTNESVKRIERHREIIRQIDRQTERQRERERDRQREREKARERERERMVINFLSFLSSRIVHTQPILILHPVNS